MATQYVKSITKPNQTKKKQTKNNTVLCRPNVTTSTEIVSNDISSIKTNDNWQSFESIVVLKTTKGYLDIGRKMISIV